MSGRGPREIAKAAVLIIEGMRGRPLDEEIVDVMTDAIWDAFVAGRESIQRKAKRRASPGGEGTGGGR